MTISIDEAIKNLKAAKKDAGMVPEDEWAPTLNLAIEALKRVKKCREDDGEIIDLPMPGETRE